MKTPIVLLSIAALSQIVVAAPVAAREDATASIRADYVQTQRAAVTFLGRQATRRDFVRVPMRDGIRLVGTLLLPRVHTARKSPVILVFNPYAVDVMIEFHAVYLRSFIENGYAVALINSRGRYFSEGVYTFLGGSAQDGYDTVDWLANQPWSSGKVGAFGCSSSAEEQHRMNAMGHPALAAAVAMGSGAGIGRVGPYAEMGNFYRGGIIQNFWFGWYYNFGWKLKPTFPPRLTDAEFARAARAWKIEPQLPPVNFSEAVGTLPLNSVMNKIGAPPSDMDDFVERLPNDPRWASTEFGGEGYPNKSPTLYINSWYDISVGPSLSLYTYQRDHAATSLVRSNTMMVVAPTLHCEQGRMESASTTVGERELGDARFDYVALVQRWFDRWLMGVDNKVTAEPPVRVYDMGQKIWRGFSSWPPKTTVATWYLTSNGHANSRFGDGKLTPVRPRRDGADRYRYDPLQPTPSVGGQFCCFDPLKPGPYDQSDVQRRRDVLVYTSEPLAEALDVTGPIRASIHLAADVTDTDLMVTLSDVHPDGRVYNLDMQALRLRWRNGYQRPELMVAGQIYQVELPPLATSNTFLPGHRLRIAIASSAFPLLERNLNTGGSNFDETRSVVANTTIYHGSTFPSWIELPIVTHGSARVGRRKVGSFNVVTDPHHLALSEGILPR